MFRVIASILFLFVAAIGHAADKYQIIGADSPVAVGDLVILSVSAPDNVPVQSTTYTWKVFDAQQEKPFAVDAEGRVFFGTGRQPRTFTVVVAVTQLLDGKAKTILLSAFVKIVDDSPPPAPVPQPTPVPEPTPAPQPLSQFSQFVNTLAKSKVVSQTRAAEAEALSRAFAKTGGELDTTVDIDVKDFLTKSKAANIEALKTFNANDRWEPFISALEDRLFQLYEDGTLSTAQSFAQIWAEVAAGLKGVR